MQIPQLQTEKPFDLTIAGELNLDLILFGLPLVMETERDLLGTGFVSTLGSSSAIVAHNAAMLGLRVRFATLIGDDDFGRLALVRLRQAGVETTDAIVDPSTTTGVTILLPHGAVRHSLSYLGSIAGLTVEHPVGAAHELGGSVAGHRAQAVVRKQNLQPARTAPPRRDEHALALRAQRRGEQRHRHRRSRHAPHAGFFGAAFHGARRSTVQPSAPRR